MTMNNVFNFKRFGKYCAYDLNNAWGNYGISAIVIGILPLILLVFNVIFSLVFTGEVSTIPIHAKALIFGVITIVVTLSAPVKLYGRLTERRAGSDWLMLPASSFEKFLSMALMLCIVLPVIVFGLFAACDLLLGWLVPAYGGSIIKSFWDGATKLPWVLDGNLNSMLSYSTPATFAAFWAGWCVAVLPFGLGAICFKKGKVAKTILCIFGVEILLSIIVVLIFKGSAGGWTDLGERIESIFENATSENIQFWVNFIANAVYFVVIGGLLAGIFFRIKTIKH
jgi:hypothetical protein